MKKTFIVALLILALAVPAMAADLKITGSARYRGFLQDNPQLDPNNEESRAWYDFRFRPVFTLKVNDSINIITRTRIFNNERFGQTAKTTTASWDRSWASIKTPYGLLEVGRMQGGTWGLDINDIEAAADRIKYTMPIGNLTVIGIFEKVSELDAVNDYTALAGGDRGIRADKDADAYHLGLVYKMENVTMGLLSSYSRNATVDTVLTSQYIFQPYFVAKFGNFGLKGEGRIINGSTEYTRTAAGVRADLDVSGQNAYIAGTAQFGPVGLELGYAYCSGDNSNSDNDQENGATWGSEYTPFVVLTDVDSLINGPGGNDSKIAALGYHVLYGSIDYNLTEAITLTGLFATATTDEKRAYSSDDIGNEFDLKFNWKVMPNLTYQVLYGYFWSGDIFKNANSVYQTATTSRAALTNVDDTWTLYHQLEITF